MTKGMKQMLHSKIKQLFDKKGAVETKHVVAIVIVVLIIALMVIFRDKVRCFLEIVFGEIRSLFGEKV